MGSMNINTSPRKLTLLVISAVLGLHVLTAVALVMVAVPAPVTKTPATTPPLEIQIVTLPDKKVVADNEIPLVEAARQPASIQNKPKATVDTQSIASEVTKPLLKETTAKPKVVSNAKTPKTPKKEPSVQKQSVPVVKNDNVIDDAAEQRKILAAQAREKALLQAQANRDAEALRQKNQQDAQALAKSKAAADAQALLDAKAAAEIAAQQQKDVAAKKAAQQALSDEPVNFTANSASWASLPNFSFPTRANRNVSSGDTFTVVLVLRVNKQGGIDTVRVAQSSGNAIIDKEAQKQVRSGRFKPFTKNNVSVIGNVTLPVSYKVP